MRQTHFLALLIFPHQYWLMNAIILSVNINICTVVNRGNFRFLVGPDYYLIQIRVFFFYQTNNSSIPNIVFPFLVAITGLLWSIFLSYHLGKHAFGSGQRFGYWFP